MVSAEALREAVEYKITPTRECMDNLAYMERSRDTLSAAVRELCEALVLSQSGPAELLRAEQDSIEETANRYRAALEGDTDETGT